MQRRVGKLKTKLDLGRLAGRMSRLLRADARLNASLIDQGGATHSQVIQPSPVHVHHDSFKDIRSALLSAERKKAEGLIELQKRRFIC